MTTHGIVFQNHGCTIQDSNAPIQFITTPGDGDYGFAGAEYGFQMEAEPAGCTFSATGLPDFLDVTSDGLILGNIPEDWANECISFDVTAADPDGNTMTIGIEISVVEDDECAVEDDEDDDEDSD